MKKLIGLLTAAAMIVSMTAMAGFASAQSIRLYGDVNSDSNVDSADALSVLQSSVHLKELDDEAKKAADVNIDNNVNTSDALLILQKTVGKVTSFAAGVSFTVGEEEPDPVDPAESYTVTETIDLAALADAGVYEITAAGVYKTVNKAANASISVNAADADVVLIFDGISLASAGDTPAINCLAAKSLTIITSGTADSTVGDSSANETSAAAIYSAAPLTLNGGKYTLNVAGNSDAGILVEGAKLEIAGGKLNVTSAGNGIQTKKKNSDFVVSGGTITVNAGGDGLKSSKTGIAVTGGNLDITSAEDGIQSETTLDISTSGTLKILSSGGHSATDKWIYEEDETGSFISINGGYMSVDETEYTGYTRYDNVSCKGIKATESISISSGSITLDCLDDAVNCDGTVNVSGSASLDISTASDGIQADTGVDISGGTFDITTSGEYISDSTNGRYTLSNGTYTKVGDGEGRGQLYSLRHSSKAVKSDTSIVISGGSFEINSADDAIHCNGSVTLTGGSFNISSNDDGIHSDTNLLFGSASATELTDGFVVNINKCYEGIEGYYIDIFDGKIFVNASDDGVNAAGGVDGTTLAKDYHLNIGGKCEMTVWSQGDGLDANGSITQSGGTVYVFGPNNSGNGALDYDSDYFLTGGTLVAIGATGMAQVPDNPSQYVLAAVPTGGTYTQGAYVNVSGNGIGSITVKLPKSYQNSFSIIVSTPDITNGSTYTFTSGGSYSGSDVNGVCSGGTYSGGSNAVSITVTNTISTYGQIGMGGTGGGGQIGGPGQGGDPGERPGR